MPVFAFSFLSELYPMAWVNWLKSYNTTARFAVWVCVTQMVIFLLNNYLIFWHGFPGSMISFSTFSLLGSLQIFTYILGFVVPAIYVFRTAKHNCIKDYRLLHCASMYIANASFWAVFIIGLIDICLAFLNSQLWLSLFFGNSLAEQLNRSAFRGTYLHMPLIFLSLLIAWKHRSISFHWLALLVVAAEFLIVICRFVFSYEQPFMGDLVRFWYAALFLFASAYTLWHEGHVRVDVFYTRFSNNKKALTNVFGCVFLGLPICWVVLVRGMWDKTHVINAPLLNFEVSQSGGFGLYVKYLMAGFLAVYAVTMMLSFCAYFLKNVAILQGDEKMAEAS